MQRYFSLPVVLKFILRLLFFQTFSVQGDVEVGVSYRKAAKEYRFTILTDNPLPSHLQGEVLSVVEIEEELARFFSALRELGVNFVRKSGLRKVMICRNLSNKGVLISGHTFRDCIYLNINFTAKTVYHEMFHVLDGRKTDRKWNRLNNPGFRYGIRGCDKYSPDFVSDYARSREREDRAETFAFMVDEGSNFLKRTVNSKILYRKMLYIIELTGRNSLLGKNYWLNKLGTYWQ